MAVKVIQDTQIPRLAPSSGVAVTSVPIALKTGYLRITIGATSSSYGGYVSIGTNPSVNRNSFHVVPYGTDILKETMKRQRISGITTGATTIVTFSENSGNPFVATDYVTIENATTSGINTTHNAIVSLTDSSVTLNFDSRSVGIVTVGASASLVKSVKVACLTDDVGTFFNISEVVTLVSE